MYVLLRSPNSPLHFLRQIHSGLREASFTLLVPVVRFPHLFLVDTKCHFFPVNVTFQGTLLIRSTVTWNIQALSYFLVLH